MRITNTYVILVVLIIILFNLYTKTHGFVNKPELPPCLTKLQHAAAITVAAQATMKVRTKVCSSTVKTGCISRLLHTEAVAALAVAAAAIKKPICPDPPPTKK